MDMIFIRTNASSSVGIGHLMRMIHLAREFSNQGYAVTFLLDKHQPHITKYTEHFNVFYLYSLSKDISLFSETDDAHRCLQILKTESVDLVIVDDYRLGCQWEDIIITYGYRIAVFDDMCDRTHNCDFLIDPKWCGSQASSQRYQNLVPARCQRLLGPSFCILSAEYRNRKPLNDPKQFTILLSVGGGGDLSQISELIENLLTLAGENDRNFCLFPVIGPLALNSEKIFDLASTDSRIQPITNATSLYQYYINTSLFVGALGTSLYELSALSIPALTFSLSSNQENDIFALEDFGHYLHIPASETLCSKSLAKLILILRNQINRVQKLRDRSLLKIDGCGTQRIVEFLGGNIAGKHEKYVNKTSDLSEKSFDSDYIHLSGGISIRKVTDADINHYLYSRNLQQNRQKSINSLEISRLDHYIWWFTSQRERDVYLLEQHQIRKLYIWHQLLNYLNSFYWIGGWMVCDSECSFNIVVAALKWQIDLTRSLKPDATWIAVIKKTNKFVNLLNKFMGFENVVESSREFHSIQQIFKFALSEEYNYVMLAP